MGRAATKYPGLSAEAKAKSAALPNGRLSIGWPGEQARRPPLSASPSDGCASGCSGCLLISLALLVGSALLVAGPVGWALAGVIVAVLLALGADKTRLPASALRRQSRPPSAKQAERVDRIQPLPAALLAPGLEQGLDQELDQLLLEARRAVDEAV